MRDPHESSHFAFQDLILLARAHRGISGPERQVLERFARHLGVSARKAQRYYRVCRKRTRAFPEDPQRQLDILKMLARVAYSDGVMQADEEAFFVRICADFGVPRTRLARVLEEAEDYAHRHRRHDRMWGFAGGLAVALIGVLIWIIASDQPDEMTGFKRLDAALRPSLVLLHTRYTLEHQSKPDRTFSATGTGFFVSSDGLVLTNKHVVQPWRFVGKGIGLLAQGYRVDKASFEITAWREGARVLDRDRKPVTETGYSTKANPPALRILALAPDAEMPRANRPAHLRVRGLFCHASDSGDLALLRCSVEGTVPALPLAEDSKATRRLDPVLVLGYPIGLKLLETANAISSPSVGRIRKIEETIYVTAPLVGGNSGGPLIDREGRVIGVATRTIGDATLAACLRIEHGRTLIERTQ